MGGRKVVGSFGRFFRREVQRYWRLDLVAFCLLIVMSVPIRTAMLQSSRGGLIVTLILPIVLVTYNRWMYFAGSHSGPSRATLGMEAFGLIAIPDGEKIKQKELDRPLSVKKATIRWICVELSTLTGGISFLSCAFHPQKKAIHDIVSKTRIVFEGDK